jgi:hypothetical protein
MTHRTTTTTRSLYRDSVARRRARGGVLLRLMVSLVEADQADLQLTMSCLDSAAVVEEDLVAVVVAVARCLDWAALVLEAVWAPPAQRVKGHVVASMLMTGLIGAAAAVMVEDVVVELADTRVADVLREGLGAAVDVVRDGVARVRHVEVGADVTNFALYHLQISISFTRSLKLKSCLYCSF